MEHAYTKITPDTLPAVALNGSELETLTRLLSKVITTATPRSSRAAERVNFVGRAERNYAFRRQREHLASAAFGDGLFVDPAWDMMLDIYIRTARGIAVGVTSLCIAATAPPTTALRYVAELERRGIIRKYRHPTDGRSLHVRMTEEGMELMDSICAHLPEHEAPSFSPMMFTPPA